MFKIKREYSYLFCLGISFFAVGILYFGELMPRQWVDRISEDASAGEHMTFMERSEDPLDVKEIEELAKNISMDVVNKTEQNGTVVVHEDGEEEILTEAGQEKKEIRQEEDKKEPVFFTGDTTYFEDALFIGDSRTEGLREYGEMGEAAVVADSGMSVYRLWKERYPVKDGKKTLEEILQDTQFGKIYIMLGVNELGYDFDHTVNKFQETIDKIKSLQPEATVFIMANLHVTDEKSSHSDIYNNDNINRINEALRELAEKNEGIYLDINPVFDDENGNLSKEYTSDHAHILGIYYSDWIKWLLNHCV